VGPYYPGIKPCMDGDRSTCYKRMDTYRANPDPGLDSYRSVRILDAQYIHHEPWHQKTS
jgi:hypothetical protein